MGTLHYIINKAEKKILYLGKHIWTFSLYSFQIKGKITFFNEMSDIEGYYPYYTETFVINNKENLYKTIHDCLLDINDEGITEDDKERYIQLCNIIVSFCNGNEVCIMHDFEDFLFFLFKNGYKQYSVFKEDDDFFKLEQ